MDISKNNFKIIYNQTKNFTSNQYNNLVNDIKNNTLNNSNITKVVNNSGKDSVISVLDKLNYTFNNNDLLFIQKGASTKKSKEDIDSATSSAIPVTPTQNLETSSEDLVVPKKEIVITPVVKNSLGDSAGVLGAAILPIQL